MFDHIAECIHKFMSNHDLLKEKIPLGFTFSFPCKQIGLNHAILTQWTKGFKCEGVEGEDVVRLLHEAIKRRGVSLVKYRRLQSNLSFREFWMERYVIHMTQFKNAVSGPSTFEIKIHLVGSQTKWPRVLQKWSKWLYFNI